MMAVDTSALMAILLDEAQADACIALLEAAGTILISAGTLSEALIVAQRRDLGDLLDGIVDGLGMEVVPVTALGARRVAQAYARWGKGVDPAGLNFGDCFAYALARERACPLLFVGEDFRRTDVVHALSSSA